MTGLLHGVSWLGALTLRPPEEKLPLSEFSFVRTCSVRLTGKFML
jgi:hypothetical protein